MNTLILTMYLVKLKAAPQTPKRKLTDKLVFVNAPNARLATLLAIGKLISTGLKPVGYARAKNCSVYHDPEIVH